MMATPSASIDAIQTGLTVAAMPVDKIAFPSDKSLVEHLFAHEIVVRNSFPPYKAQQPGSPSAGAGTRVHAGGTLGVGCGAREMTDDDQDTMVQLSGWLLPEMSTPDGKGVALAPVNSSSSSSSSSSSRSRHRSASTDMLSMGSMAIGTGIDPGGDGDDNGSARQLMLQMKRQQQQQQQQQLNTLHLSMQQCLTGLQQLQQEIRSTDSTSARNTPASANRALVGRDDAIVGVSSTSVDIIDSREIAKRGASTDFAPRRKEEDEPEYADGVECSREWDPLDYGRVPEYFFRRAMERQQRYNPSKSPTQQTKRRSKRRRRRAIKDRVPTDKLESADRVSTDELEHGPWSPQETSDGSIIEQRLDEREAELRNELRMERFQQIETVINKELRQLKDQIERRQLEQQREQRKKEQQHEEEEGHAERVQRVQRVQLSAYDEDLQDCAFESSIRKSMERLIESEQRLQQAKLHVLGSGLSNSASIEQEEELAEEWAARRSEEAEEWAKREAMLEARRREAEAVQLLQEVGDDDEEEHMSYLLQQGVEEVAPPPPKPPPEWDSPPCSGTVMRSAHMDGAIEESIEEMQERSGGGGGDGDDSDGGFLCTPPISPATPTVDKKTVAPVSSTSAPNITANITVPPTATTPGPPSRARAASRIPRAGEGGDALGDAQDGLRMWVSPNEQLRDDGGVDGRGGQNLAGRTEIALFGGGRNGPEERGEADASHASGTKDNTAKHDKRWRDWERWNKLQQHHKIKTGQKEQPTPAQKMLDRSVNVGSGARGAYTQSQGPVGGVSCSPGASSDASSPGKDCCGRSEEQDSRGDGSSIALQDGGRHISFVSSPVTSIPFQKDLSPSSSPAAVAAAVEAALSPASPSFRSGLPTGEMNSLASNSEASTRTRSDTSYYSRPGKAYCLQCGELILQDSPHDDPIERHARHCASSLPAEEPSPPPRQYPRSRLPSPLSLQLSVPAISFLQKRSSPSLPVAPSPIPPSSFSAPYSNTASRSPQCAQM
jgi:hypothetical protein